MKKPAKRVVSKGVLGAVGAAVLGVFAGAAAMFLSKEENREKVKKVVDSGVKKGKEEARKLSAKGKKALKSARKRIK